MLENKRSIDQMPKDNSLELTKMIAGIRGGTIDIELPYAEVELGNKLGAGGSKTVYAAEISGDPIALAIPNVVDNLNTIKDKWADVEKEPANTEFIRSLGLYTNPVCDLLPTTLNGTQFKVLRMKRYEDLPFEVRDAKNGTSSIYRSEILPDGLVVTNETIADKMVVIAREIAQLVKANIELKRDSINICIDNGELHLYLNDIGTMQIGGADIDRAKWVLTYVQFAIQAFVSALSESEYQRNREILDLFFSIDEKEHSLTSLLIEKVNQQLSLL